LEDADVPVLDPKDYIGIAIAAFVLWGGKYLRSLLIDVVNRTRFLMGFVTILAAYWDGISDAINEMDESGLQPKTKLLLFKVKTFMEQVKDLLKQVLTSKETRHKMDSSLVTIMQKMIDDYKRWKGIDTDDSQTG
jgi:hypothetical protein